VCLCWKVGDYNCTYNPLLPALSLAGNPLFDHSGAAGCMQRGNKGNGISIPADTPATAAASVAEAAMAAMAAASAAAAAAIDAAAAADTAARAAELEMQHAHTVLQHMRGGARGGGKRYIDDEIRGAAGSGLSRAFPASAAERAAAASFNGHGRAYSGSPCVRITRCFPSHNPLTDEFWIQRITTIRISRLVCWSR